MKSLLTLALLISCIKGYSLDPNHFTITRISAPYFIVDGNVPTSITKAYVGFEIKNNSNSAVTYANLKFTISSIGTSVVGQNYSVVSPATGVINIGTLAPGQSRVCYFYIAYPAHVTAQGTFNVLLSDNTATSKSQAFIIRNRSSISANAGGTATQSFSNQDIIGGLIQDDVTYVVGNVQNGDENDFQVAVSSQFDPTKISLLATEVIASAVPGITVGTTDSLYFITGNGSNGASITIRYTFRITGYNFTTYLLPCAGATSGSTNYKYALNTSLGSGTPITVSSTANPLTITKTSDKNLYGTNAAAIFTITISNPGSFPVTIDKIIDQLPAGFTFQSITGSSQVTSSNSTQVPSNGTTGTISFEGGVVSGSNTSYVVPAGGTLVLSYTATSGAVSASNLTTTVRDYIATTEVGAANNTVSVSATLPVSLIYFKGHWNKSFVNLEWKSLQEINSEVYEVERENGVNGFQKIGSVRAAGNSDMSRSYSFIDSFPLPGLNNYRLKLIDRDSRAVFSSIISLTGAENDVAIKIYPNPFIHQVNLIVFLEKPMPVRLRLTDASGKRIMVKTENGIQGENNFMLNDLSSLNPGIYFLEIFYGSKASKFKLVKPN